MKRAPDMTTAFCYQDRRRSAFALSCWISDVYYDSAVLSMFRTEDGRILIRSNFLVHIELYPKRGVVGLPRNKTYILIKIAHLRVSETSYNVAKSLLSKNPLPSLYLELRWADWEDVSLKDCG
jgi:hypothetical protein